MWRVRQYPFRQPQNVRVFHGDVFVRESEVSGLPRLTLVAPCRVQVSMRTSRLVQYLFVCKRNLLFLKQYLMSVCHRGGRFESTAYSRLVTPSALCSEKKSTFFCSGIRMKSSTAWKPDKEKRREKGRWDREWLFNSYPMVGEKARTVPLLAALIIMQPFFFFFPECLSFMSERYREWLQHFLVAIIQSAD